MRKVQAFVVLAAMMFCAADVSAGPVINGGFETGDPTGWRPEDRVSSDWWKIAVVSDVQHSGVYSRMILMDAQANMPRRFYQDLDLTGGYDTLSFYLNADLNPNDGSSSCSGGTYAGAKLVNIDTGDLIAELVTIGGLADDGTSVHYGTDGWEYYAFDLTDYTDLTNVRLTFWMTTLNNCAPANERLYVDDVTLSDGTTTPIPAPAALLLTGLGSGLVGVLRRRRTI